jgi:endonuclease/exonuclease/phosphatase family metal-dependent hydrolase
MIRTVLVWLALAGGASSQTLSVISWNVESGGADPAVIARELKELPRVDAYLLQEVAGGDIGRFAAAIRDAHGSSYKYYVSSLGGADRLAIVFDEEKFRVRAFSELFSFGDFTLNDWRHRPPLVARLEGRGDGREFLLVTVHLARSNAGLRTQQAKGLRAWAAVQEAPVVLAGDCNFDYDFRTGKGNAAYDAFVEGEVWRIVEPADWIDTNWSDNNGDGKDDYPDSVLDFAAVCTGGERLRATCEVIVRDGDFPDTKATSDHRPILLTCDFAPPLTEEEKQRLAARLRDSSVLEQLRPFTASGFWQPGDTSRSTNLEKTPISLSRLKESGALNSGHEGLARLLAIANESGMGNLVNSRPRYDIPVTYSGAYKERRHIDTDRPKWSYPRDYQSLTAEQLQEVENVQKLLIELGPVMVEQELLAP